MSSTNETVGTAFDNDTVMNDNGDSDILAQSGLEDQALGDDNGSVINGDGRSDTGSLSSDDPNEDDCGSDPAFNDYDTDPSSGFSISPNICTQPAADFLLNLFTLPPIVEAAISAHRFSSALEVSGLISEARLLQWEVNRKPCWGRFKKVLNCLLTTLDSPDITEQLVHGRLQRRVSLRLSTTPIDPSPLPFKHIGLIVPESLPMKSKYSILDAHSFYLVGTNWLDLMRRSHYAARKLFNNAERRFILGIACCQMDPHVRFIYYDRNLVTCTSSLYLRNPDHVELIARGLVAWEVLIDDKLGYDDFRKVIRETSKSKPTSVWYVNEPDEGPGRWYKVTEILKRRHDITGHARSTMNLAILRPSKARISSSSIERRDEDASEDVEIMEGLFVLPRHLERCIKAGEFAKDCNDLVEGWDTDNQEPYLKFKGLFDKITSTAFPSSAPLNSLAVPSSIHQSLQTRTISFTAYISPAAVTPFSPFGLIERSGHEGQFMDELLSTSPSLNSPWDNVLGVWIVERSWADARRRGRYLAQFIMNGSFPGADGGKRFVVVFECVISPTITDYSERPGKHDRVLPSEDPQIAFSIYSYYAHKTRAYRLKNSRDLSAISRVVLAFSALDEQRIGGSQGKGRGMAMMYWVPNPQGFFNDSDDIQEKEESNAKKNDDAECDYQYHEFKGTWYEMALRPEIDLNATGEIQGDMEPLQHPFHIVPFLPDLDLHPDGERTL